MRDLVESYKKTVRNCRVKKRTCSDNVDQQLWGQMENSCLHIIQLMGRYVDDVVATPDTRTILVEPQILNTLATSPDPFEILYGSHEEELKTMNLDLRFLSAREFIVLKYYYLDGMTLRAIASKLGIHAGSVQRFLERGREKILKVKGLQLALLPDEVTEDGVYLSGLRRESPKVSNN